MEYFNDIQDYYIGEYKNGKFNGIGKYIYGDQTEYIGNFKDGLKDGIGKVTGNDFVYTGEFIEDCKEGEGIIEWKKKADLAF